MPCRHTLQHAQGSKLDAATRRRQATREPLAAPDRSRCAFFLAACVTCLLQLTTAREADAVATQRRDLIDVCTVRQASREAQSQKTASSSTCRRGNKLRCQRALYSTGWLATHTHTARPTGRRARERQRDRNAAGELPSAMPPIPWAWQTRALGLGTEGAAAVCVPRLTFLSPRREVKGGGGERRPIYAALKSVATKGKGTGAGRLWSMRSSVGRAPADGLASIDIGSSSRVCACGRAREAPRSRRICGEGRG